MVRSRTGSGAGLSTVTMAIQCLLDLVVRGARTHFQGGVKLDTCQVQVLLFADDTILVTETKKDLEHNINAMQAAVKEHKLAVNWTKTNTIPIGKGAR